MEFWYGSYVYGELGVRYRLKDGLGVSKRLHEFFRNSDLFFMANYAQTVNVLGSIKTSTTAAELESTGLVLALYRNQFGVIPIETSESTAGLDVSAAWTADKKAITISIVNLSNKAEELNADFGKVAFKQPARRWTVDGPDSESYNEPGKPQAIKVTADTIGIKGGVLAVPPLSVVIYRLELR